MSEPKFTKGPWHVVLGKNKRLGTNYPHQIATATGKAIIAWGSILFKAKEEGQANSHLIAASPDLYYACQAQNEAIDRLFARLVELDPTFFPSKSGQPCEAFVQGKSALEKAVKK